MRLDFRVVWIDDQPLHVRSFAEGIRRRLRDQGFELIVKEVKSLDDLEGIMGSHVHDDGIDLVLVDYDLGAGSGGEQALAKVRQHFPYKDVVFYSALDTDKLRRIAFDAKLDGVHFSTRVSLTDDTCNVIDSAVRRVMDVDHMRGVVMSATSDIDVLVQKSLLAAYAKLSEEEKGKLLSDVVAHLRGKLERHIQELDQADSKKTLAGLEHRP